MFRFTVSFALSAIVALCTMPAAATEGPAAEAVARAAASRLTPYQSRFGRSKPVVAIIGHNGGTEVTDYLIPYGVLSESGAADVQALAVHDGPLHFRPALDMQPQATMAEFDRRYPDGADYVVVPAMMPENANDPALLGWLRAQAGKGAKIASICDGALVVAAAGLFEGRKATGHWASLSERRTKFPRTQWLENVRYVEDGNVMSTAGISAAMPFSVALVEAIAGPARAAELAGRMGIADWGNGHDSTRFGITPGIATAYLANRWLMPRQTFAVLAEDGVDEIALALTVDAYSSTNRSHAGLVAPQGAVRTKHGLTLLPEQTAVPGSTGRLAVDGRPATQQLERALADIAQRYGASTARLVAMHFEVGYD
ncbi:transcriptional regulator [Oxalobacteraceae bacterium OM1]|nr:transcriptional regulator [Oxalobacteraceae bacterium OM1]